MLKKLIFIPYQDIFDFTNTGILTREYSILNFFIKQGIEDILFVSKPRTILDKRQLKEVMFPEKSIEFEMYEKIINSTKYRYEVPIKLDLILKKRAWWIEGYYKTLKLLNKENINYEETIVYSNNPFSFRLLEYMKSKGATVYFDMMDNLAIHPSLTEKEQKSARESYRKSFYTADFITCNSKSILKFCEETFNQTPVLVKNGVSPINESISIIDEETKNKIEVLNKLKDGYECIVGYIGKLGLRLDEKLIEQMVSNNHKVLFVFVGPHLSGQTNKTLENLFVKYENLISLGSIPSCYINNFLNVFSILMIPHSVGKYENGGDPLKLYQYLNTGKPIISTKIEGVDEFKDIITITNDIKEWNEFIYRETKSYEIPKTIYWNERLSPLAQFLKMEAKKFE